MYDPHDSSRTALRAQRLSRALAELGHRVGEDEALAVLKACEREHDLHDGEEEWGPADQVGWILKRLSVDSALRARAHVAVIGPYGDAALAVPPEVFPDAKAVVAELARSYGLALICNTGATPGRVLRVLLDRSGLSGHFKVMVFSDELGYRKPSPRAFDAALAGLGLAAGNVAHIGDNPLTDVQGAKRAGMRGILLTGGWHGSRPYRSPGEADAAAPDAIATSLVQLPAVIAALEAAAAGPGKARGGNLDPA
ncbi:MAG: HAD family hydrolase [Bacillota bacterium]|nr:HAD family hydrolase [Bacillota bacterium]